MQNVFKFCRSSFILFWVITMDSTPLLTFIFCIVMYQCCRSWDCKNKHHARSSSMPVLVCILCTETPTPIAIPWPGERFDYWCCFCSTCEYIFSGLCWYLFHIFMHALMFQNDQRYGLPTHLLIIPSAVVMSKVSSNISWCLILDDWYFILISLDWSHWVQNVTLKFSREHQELTFLGGKVEL